MSATVVDRHFLQRGRGVEFEMEASWIARHLPAQGAIADIGCGIGALFELIGRDRVIGIDYQLEGLAHTSTIHTDVPLVCADATNLPFPDNAFAALTAQHVIEHIADYPGTVSEWARVLRPGGVMLILTPNARFIDPSVYDDDTHVHIFDETDLPGVVQQAGLTISEMTTLGLPWFRAYDRYPAGWRLRRFVTENASTLDRLPGCRGKGQTLCCKAIKAP